MDRSSATAGLAALAFEEACQVPPRKNKAVKRKAGQSRCILDVSRTWGLARSQFRGWVVRG